MSNKNLDKKSYHHGNLRESLINSAIDLLEKEGIEKLSLRSVAKYSNVSQAAPYSHFKDKTTLLADVAAVGFQRLSQDMLKNSRKQKKGYDKLIGLSSAYINFAMDNKDIFKLMYSHEFKNMQDYPVLLNTAGKSYAMFSHVVNICCMGDPDKDIKSLTVTIWGAVHGITSLIIEGKLDYKLLGYDNLEQFIKSNIDILYKAI